jgi:3-hexulose-6-phosphate synthase
MRPKIQVALDLLRIQDALNIASKAAEYVDYLEAGTPLIKAEGLRAVTLLKKEFGDKVVVADMKTMDTGFLEASIAYEAGADYATVMAAADIGTVSGAVEARDKYGKGIMIDLLGVEDLEYARKLDELKPDYLLIHSGIDMQHRGIMPFEPVKKLSNMGLSAKIGVAGGLNKENIGGLQGLKVDLIIVGGFITKADDPGKAAKEVLEAVEEVF